MTQLETERGMVRVPPGTWNVDPAHSTVGFTVKHLLISTVRGQFREFEGTIEAAEEGPAYSRSGAASTWRRSTRAAPIATPTCAPPTSSMPSGTPRSATSRRASSTSRTAGT